MKGTGINIKQLLLEENIHVLFQKKKLHNISELEFISLTHLSPTVNLSFFILFELLYQ